MLSEEVGVPLAYTSKPSMGHATSNETCPETKMDFRGLVRSLILLTGIFFLETNFASCKDQPCEQNISSDVTKNGTITSPNYPEPYPADVFCTYRFIGRRKERVQIVFTDFDLHLPHEPPREYYHGHCSKEWSLLISPTRNSTIRHPYCVQLTKCLTDRFANTFIPQHIQTLEFPSSCDSVDALMVFITINRQKERVDNFCGNKLPNQLMSNDPTMSVEFRSFHSSPEVKGFRAIYRFITDFGVTGGKQDNDSVCQFTFMSDVLVNGTFTSPNYPGYYPRDTECRYLFQGKPKERIRITFAHFDVDGIDACTSDTASDYVEFSNYKTVDRKIPRHCGERKPNYIESDGNYFRVTFKSNDKFDGTGFKAFYQFKTVDDPLTVKRISTANDSNPNAGCQCRKRTSLLFLILLTFVLKFVQAKWR